VFTFAIGWIVGLLLLLPLKLVSKRREQQEVEMEIKLSEMPPLRRAVFYVGHGHLPKWLYVPFLVIGLSLTGITALIILGLLVHLITSW